MYNNCIYKILINNSCLKNDIISSGILNSGSSRNDVLCVPIKKIKVKIEEIINENRLSARLRGINRYYNSWTCSIIENENIYLTERLSYHKYKDKDADACIDFYNPGTYKYVEELLKNDIEDFLHEDHVCGETIKLICFRRVENFFAEKEEEGGEDMFLNESEIADLLRLYFYRPYLTIPSDKFKDTHKTNLIYEEGGELMKEPGKEDESVGGTLYIPLYKSLECEYLEKNKCFFNNKFFYGGGDKFDNGIENDNYKWVSVKFFTGLGDIESSIIRMFLRIDKDRISLPVNETANRLLTSLFPLGKYFPPELLEIRGDVYVSHYIREKINDAGTRVSYTKERPISPYSLKVSDILCDIHSKLSYSCLNNKFNHSRDTPAKFMIRSPSFCSENLISFIYFVKENEKLCYNFDNEMLRLTKLYNSILSKMTEMKITQKRRRFDAIGRKLENKLKRKRNKFKIIEIPLCCDKS